MACVQRAKHLLRCLGQIPGVDFFHGHDGQQVVARITQGNFLPQLHIVFRLHGQGDGDGEEVAAGKAHLIQHALVVSLPQEAV